MGPEFDSPQVHTQMNVARDAIRLAAKKGYVADESGSVTGPSGKCLKLRFDGDGYLTFNVRMDSVVGRRYVRRVRVQRLVSYQKYGEASIAAGIETRHKDGDKTNNEWSNILIGTRSDNEMDRSPEERSARSRHASLCRWGLETPTTSR